MTKNPHQPSNEVTQLGNVEYRNPLHIRLAPDNPRKISDKAIQLVALSLETFGWQQPIVVDSDGFVLAGHTRLKAAGVLNLKTVPVVVADKLSPEDARAYRIADNRTRDFTSWDLPELAAQLDELSESYAEVLALADWEAVVADYDELIEAVGGDPFGLPDEVQQVEFALTVVFCAEVDALAAQKKIAETIQGVIDVRVKR